MKTRILICISLLIVSLCYSQGDQEHHMLLIGDMAPSFKANTTQGSLDFPNDYYGKWKVIFSHPADFTSVCTTEIMELAHMQDEFKKLNAAIIVISTDRLNSHIQWIKSMESIKYKDYPSLKINFPLISDYDLKISKLYGMIHATSDPMHTIRAVYVIDPSNHISAIFYYPPNVGRNLEEIKRTLIALQLSDKKEVLTPANWYPGNDLLLPSPATANEAEKIAAKNSKDLYSLAWYLWFVRI